MFFSTHSPPSWVPQNNPAPESQTAPEICDPERTQSIAGRWDPRRPFRRGNRAENPSILPSFRGVGRASGRGPAGPLHQPAMQAPGREGVRGGAPLPDPQGRVSHPPDMRKGRPRGHRPEASEAVPRARQEGCPRSGRGELVRAERGPRPAGPSRALQPNPCEFT